MPLSIDKKTEQFGKVKSLFSGACYRAQCPINNDAINDLADYMVRVCEQEGTDPVDHARAFVEFITNPGDHVGALVSRRIFFHKATGGKFSGG